MLTKMWRYELNLRVIAMNVSDYSTLGNFKLNMKMIQLQAEW